jgi:hypothetical protein
MKSGGDIHSGLKTKQAAGDSGRRAQREAASINSESTRSGVAKSHSIGGRTA